MRVVIDIETNSIIRPSKIWVIVCKDLDTGAYYVFREPTQRPEEATAFKEFIRNVHLLIGHNSISFDIPNIVGLLFSDDYNQLHCKYIDTYICSKLLDYSRENGHSIEAYGDKFQIPKLVHTDFTKYSKELEDYCKRDVDICHKIYEHYSNTINDPKWQEAINLEHDFQWICNDLHDNGFAFNTTKAKSLLEKVEADLGVLDDKIHEAFPPKEVLVKEFTPRATKYGTIAKPSVPRSLWSRIHEYEIGKTYPVYKTQNFNPGSHKQLVEVLTEAGWKPIDKSKTHIDTEREISRLKYSKGTKDKDEALINLTSKLEYLKIYGWKVNEDNLDTLPSSAPEPSRLLAKRILLESRRRTLREWLDLVQDDGRIHGQFHGIGAWTHRMSHQRPNTANIPNSVNINGSTKLLGKELRSLWTAPKNRLLVGIDAEGIQLRIFAHYINDKEFTDALVRGRKSDKSDPHSLNQRILGSVCKTRQAAKRFVYALLLGGGIGKLAYILECTVPEAKEALVRLLQRYTGFAFLRETVFPTDAKRGWFTGLDGRKVPIPGETISERKHLAMSGYLQNGEAIIIKKTALIAKSNIRLEKDLKSWLYVNIVHDELQSEIENKMRIALQVAEIIDKAIREAGEYYKLKCPMAGSYWNDDNKDYTIGTNWYQTH